MEAKQRFVKYLNSNLPKDEIFPSLAELTTAFNQWCTKFQTPSDGEPLDEDKHTAINTIMYGHTRWLKVCINKHVMRKWAKEFRIKFILTEAQYSAQRKHKYNADKVKRLKAA